MKKEPKKESDRQKEVKDPLMYTRPAKDGVIDPLAYTKPPVDDVFDPLLYTRTPNDGTVDPFVYTKPPAEVSVNASESVQLRGASKDRKAHIVVRPKERCEWTKDGAVGQKISAVKEEQVSGIIKAKKFSATNFFVKPVERLVYINRFGKEVPDKEKIISLVYIRGEPYPFAVKIKEIASLVKNVQRRYAEAIIDHREQNAPKVIEERFRDGIRYCAKRMIYFEAGWQQIGGVRVYLRDGLNMGGEITIETGMTLPALSCGAEMLRNIWERSMCICRNLSTMAVIFAFSLMGVLYRLFKDAGYAPHFTLFLYGKTGSMKTTIAKIFFTQLCEERYRDSVRRIDADTEASLERAVVSSGYDTITLIDDFSPAKTERKKREMTDKLEMVIRMVGDGSSRSRSNVKLDDRRGEGVQGMVALTGELLGKGLSSNLRCLYCKMERENADEKVITWFQNNKYFYTTLIAAFADFVGMNYQFAVDYIRNRFSEERKEISRVVREYRLIDSTAMLCTALYIFGKFLTDCCKMPRNEAERRILEMRSGIIDCAVISEELSTDESPSVTFVQTISELMRMGQVVLSKEKCLMAKMSESDGFEDETFLYFNPAIVHRKVVAFMRQSNRYFPFDLKEVQSMLADDRIIRTATNGRGKRTYCVRILVGNGVRCNFLRIRKTIFDAICDGEFECGKGELE